MKFQKCNESNYRKSYDVSHVVNWLTGKPLDYKYCLIIYDVFFFQQTVYTYYCDYRKIHSKIGKRGLVVITY